MYALYIAKCGWVLKLFPQVETLDIEFKVHIQSKLLLHMFVMGASSDVGQPFCPRQKKGFWLGKE